ncbi:unnamed protein product [Penicillium bialowiezense]
MPIEMTPLNEAQSDTAEESVPLKPSSTISKRRKSILLDTWLFESFALAFSLACFIAILGLLIRPELAYNLSLNAIISILATGCKSSLILVIGEAICQLKWLSFKKTRQSQLFGMQVFDAASRGPLGSLGIIVHHRAQSLVCLGAAVIVLLLAFDPFMQQVISYPVRPVSISYGQAAAKQVRGMSTTDLREWENAFGQGLWSHESFDLSPTCSSGNCTWDEFSSVGICSHCEEITSSARLKCNLGNARKWLNQTCEITLPFGKGYNFSVTMQKRFGDGSTGAPTRGSGNGFRFPNRIIWTPHGMNEWLTGASVGGLVNPLVGHAYAELAPSPNVSLTAPLANRISIKKLTVCAQTSCLRDYHVSMKNGQASIKTGNVDFGTRSPVDSDITWTPRNRSKASFAFSEYGDGTSMQWVQISSWGFFPVEITPRTFIFEDNHWSDGDLVVFDTNPLINRVRNIGFPSVMSDIAASFTKLVLENSNGTVNGTVQASKVFVSVQWPWLTLPAVLVVLGAMFFIGTTATNRKAKMPLWKSSALAPFYHGLEELEGNEFKSSSTMETTAEGENVRLRYSEAKGRFMLQRP